MIYAIAIASASLMADYTALEGSQHPSFERCWHTIWVYRMHEENVSCELIGVRDTAAPATSIRPKARTK